MKATPIATLYIPCVIADYNEQYIKDVFQRMGIAQVDNVYRSAYYHDYTKFSVFIDIISWYETDTAVKFIHDLRSENNNAKLYYEDNNWWNVTITKSTTNNLPETKRVLKSDTQECQFPPLPSFT